MLNVFYWIFKIVTSLIILQTLFFKFTGAQESIFIFEKMGLEPIGRIGSGIFELIAIILLWNPKTSILGALSIIFIMLGAIASHIFILGIEVQDDKGLLFGLALTSFVGGCYLFWYSMYKNKTQSVEFSKKLFLNE
ncbi:DoxX family protein [Leptospira sp. GIMC2001]|uniref:DoxX family protein n=1 Tax=Leptospira sp. GIMC2001 TaxID=1513297 RepID=UPI00234BA7A3|nr:DoxX family protein [Leptospira sp. GIMC2001]WCL49289.1 DoxX family protein [Leptospira sp. GIMC2001]